MQEELCGSEASSPCGRAGERLNFQLNMIKSK